MHPDDVNRLAAKIAPERPMRRLVVAQHGLGDDRHALGEIVERPDLLRAKAVLVVMGAIEGQPLIDIVQLPLQIRQHLRLALGARTRFLGAIPIGAVRHDAPPSSNVLVGVPSNDVWTLGEVRLGRLHLGVEDGASDEAGVTEEFADDLA